MGLSLCLIARNEARFLSDCLESVRAVVDEIIVVDTGSTDGTVAIAERFGARVFHHRWTDDFSAARNVGLDQARGSHILTLDADERLAPNSAEALRAACAGPELAVGILPLHNADSLDAPVSAIVSGECRIGDPIHLPRLFPNRPELRYRGRVHETIAPDLTWLTRTIGGRAQWIEAPIVHYGDVPELRSELSKPTRNIELLERALAEDPSNLSLPGYLAGEYYQAGRATDALRLGALWLPQLLGTLDAQAPHERRVCTIRLGALFALCMVDAGRAAEALWTVAECRARSGEHPNLNYVEGRAHESLGRFGDAIESYETCLEAPGRYSTPVFRGITGPQSRLRVANCLLALGEPADALECLPASRGTALVHSALLRAEAHLQLGQHEEALRWLGALRGLQTPPPDVFELCVHAKRALGTLTTADRDLAEQARGLPPERWVEPRRRLLGEALGALARA